MSSSVLLSLRKSMRERRLVRFGGNVVQLLMILTACGFGLFTAVTNW